MNKLDVKYGLQYSLGFGTTQFCPSFCQLTTYNLILVCKYNFLSLIIRKYIELFTKEHDVSYRPDNLQLKQSCSGKTHQHQPGGQETCAHLANIGFVDLLFYI